MANINLSQKSYVDYVASLYFAACGVRDLKLTPKVVKVGEKDTVLVHISGVQTNSGIVVNVDLWPRNEATAEDVTSLPKSLDDIIFRIGYWPEINTETGEQLLRQGTPKWLSYVSGGKTITLSGDKREFAE